jgi:hypothetical protein
MASEGSLTRLARFIRQLWPWRWARCALEFSRGVRVHRGQVIECMQRSALGSPVHNFSFCRVCHHSRRCPPKAVADLIAVGAIPANYVIWTWLDKLDLLLRIGVSAGIARLDRPCVVAESKAPGGA